MSPSATDQGRSARSISRLALGASVGLVAAAAMPVRLGVALRLVAGWNAAAITGAALIWWIIARATPSETRKHAASDDPGRAATSRRSRRGRCPPSR